VKRKALKFETLCAKDAVSYLATNPTLIYEKLLIFGFTTLVHVISFRYWALMLILDELARRF